MRNIRRALDAWSMIADVVLPDYKGNVARIVYDTYTNLSPVDVSASLSVDDWIHVLKHNVLIPLVVVDVAVFVDDRHVDVKSPLYDVAYSVLRKMAVVGYRECFISDFIMHFAKKYSLLSSEVMPFIQSSLGMVEVCRSRSEM